ncbi:MAG: cupin domain-containing protein [Chloroflexi bacterium]|nr:cupin domain-containing protein [Chloroflexota bacterium]
MATDSDRDIVRATEPTGELEKLIIEDPYRGWLADEGVQIIDEFVFEDLATVELGPWERKGGKGSVINIPYPMLINDSQLIEIKPGGQSVPEHHLYEEVVYVISGRGATSVWIDENGPKQTFEWKGGSMFTIPLNAWYQNFNASGDEPARYLAVTTAPVALRTYNDSDFIFNNNYVFKGRYGQEETFFSGSGKLYAGRVWQASFLPNVPDMPLYSWEGRGAGGINAMFDMAGNQMKGHVSEFPVGTYKKGHQHGPGAHLLILSGDAGYSLTWTKEDMSDVVKSDWKVGSMVIVPSANCYHQHFNTGSRRARYLAIGYGSGGEAPGLYAPFAGSGGADVSQKQGGMQVEYDDENPIVLDMFEEDCIKHGATPDMRRYFPERTEYKVTLPA